MCSFGAWEISNIIPNCIVVLLLLSFCVKNPTAIFSRLQTYQVPASHSDYAHFGSIDTTWTPSGLELLDVLSAFDHLLDPPFKRFSRFLVLCRYCWVLRLLPWLALHCILCGAILLSMELHPCLLVLEVYPLSVWALFSFLYFLH